MVMVFLSRALFLPPTLEDIDSVNFALALEDFDPSRHQPHPPGYPVYVAFARLAHAVIPEPAKALGLLSALAQAILVLPLMALFRRLGSPPGRSALSVILVLTCPIVWFNGARPMSDSLGLLFVVSAQALLLGSLKAGKADAAASLLAGLAIGVRLQAGLLTVPLWLWTMWRARAWRRPCAAFAMGVLMWLIPVVAAAGGPTEYAVAFARTMSEAAVSEPLLSGLTLHRLAHTLYAVAVAPWILGPLGLVIALLAALGSAAALLRGPRALALATVAFLPYFLVHTLIQEAQALRYSLPYVPWIAWLAVEGVAFLCDRLPRPRAVEAGVCAGLSLVSAAWTLPALSQYHQTQSPPLAALSMVRERAIPPQDFVLAGHHLFRRHIPSDLKDLEVLDAEPGKVLDRLTRHLLNGDRREVLFLANPRRTDLASLSPESRRLLGRWEWPLRVRPFLAGARPNEVELFSIRPPRFFTREGWLLSLESGRLDSLHRDPVRLAYLAELPQTAFLLVAGMPAGDGECRLSLEIKGLISDRSSCREPLLAGYLVPASSNGEGYRQLSITTRNDEGTSGAPFALQSLDYGPEDVPGLVQGEGWFHPEKDERLRKFRWTSPLARSLLHIPAGGVRLIIEGAAPLKYLGSGLKVRLTDNHRVLATATVSDGSFRLEATIARRGRPFHEVVLSADRSFVPHTVQRNGDRRRLALRVYSVVTEPLRQTP